MHQKVLSYLINGEKNGHTPQMGNSVEMRHTVPREAAGALTTLTANLRAHYRAKRHINTKPNANP